uniref:acetate uptake transporter n=1 Tax=Caballeronia sp. BR00000012568055 TaxID=2918761 RepID=UPI0023F9DCEF
VFTFYMWIATFRSPRALQLIFLALWITFFLLAASDLTGMIWLHRAGGYAGLVTALLAFYLSAAEIINETHARAVLPVGLVNKGAPVDWPAAPVETPSSHRLGDLI